jgi:hypothetical protein
MSDWMEICTATPVGALKIGLNALGLINYLQSVVKTKIPYTLVLPEYYSSVFYIASPRLE